MTNNTFHNLPVEDFIGRRVKASLGDLGVCIVTFKGMKKNRFTVAIKSKGVETIRHVESIHINPFWSENQDLFQRMMVLKNRKDHVGENNLGVVFEAFAKDLEQKVLNSPDLPPHVAVGRVEPPAPHIVPQTSTELSQASTEPMVVQRPDHRVKWESVQPSAPRVIKRLIVSMDCKDGWMEDLAELKKTLSEKSHHEERLAFHQKALADHDGLVELYIESLEERGISIIWDDAKPVKTIEEKFSQAKARIAGNPRQPRSGNWMKLRDRMLERMVPLKNYTLSELMTLIEVENKQTFTNTLPIVLKNCPEFVSRKFAGQKRTYTLK